MDLEAWAKPELRQTERVELQATGRYKHTHTHTIKQSSKHTNKSTVGKQDFSRSYVETNR